MNTLSEALARDIARIVRPLVQDAVREAFPTTTAPPTKPGKEWLTNAEAMAYLGLSKPTLARYRADGALPYSKVGGNVFYRITDVEALLERHLVGAKGRQPKQGGKR